MYYKEVVLIQLYWKETTENRKSTRKDHVSSIFFGDFQVKQFDQNLLSCNIRSRLSNGTG